MEKANIYSLFTYVGFICKFITQHNFKKYYYIMEKQIDNGEK